MKIDMGRHAITLRLRQVSQLRRACMALAESSAGLRIRRRSTANKSDVNRVNGGEPSVGDKPNPVSANIKSEPASR